MLTWMLFYNNIQPFYCSDEATNDLLERITLSARCKTVISDGKRGGNKEGGSAHNLLWHILKTIKTILFHLNMCFLNNLT